MNLSILQNTGVGSIWQRFKLNVLNGQCLNRRIDDIRTIERETRAWQKYRNNKEAKVDWQFTADDARIKLKRLYPTIGD